MANRTAKDAHTVKGTNPQYLIEKIVRTRIYDSKYWKEECFALSADLLIDKGMELRFIGGTYGGNIKPSPFLCLILKLLQIQPDKDIIIEYIRQEDFKYLRALGAMYMRLTGTSVEVFKYLEPLYNDYRKLRYMNRMGEFELLHMDELIDQLLRDERVCDIQLPRLQKRDFLEETAQLEERTSALDEDLDEPDSDSDENVPEPSKKQPASKDSSSRVERKRSRSPKISRTRERDRGSRSKSPTERRRRSPERKDRGGRDRDKDKRHQAASDRKRTREDSYEREIREANELRAKLGLKPLEQ